MKHASKARAVTVVAALAAAACGGAAETAAPDQTRRVPVRTVLVDRRDLEDRLVLTGTLRPRARVEVVAEVSARLLRVLADEGAQVKGGQVLAVLDETDYRLAHQRATAALAVAEANRAHGVAERDRAESLLETGGITDKDHLAAQVSLQVAEASLAQARAEAAIAAQQHARAQVRAPFAGRIAKRQADPGAMLAAGGPIFTLVDDSVLEFRAAVPSADYARVRVGAAVDVEVDARPGAAVRGRVARITPLVEERTRSFAVVVEVPWSAGLVGGMFARAIVHVGEIPGALVLPPAALIRDGADPLRAEVFLVEEAVARRRTVGLGVEGPDTVQVTSGLTAGQTVVLDPPVTLGDGAPVEIQAAAR
ncbi:MAG TPA: efflux RND transporter periplasmic adaptor subunit [Vicinamibacteria bacterium]|nr:efflux RND transporter periplasmic adaptor subunit [Vicinamibacteria bacterium]